MAFFIYVYVFCFRTCHASTYTQGVGLRRTKANGLSAQSTVGDFDTWLSCQESTVPGWPSKHIKEKGSLHGKAATEPLFTMHCVGCCEQSSLPIIAQISEDDLCGGGGSTLEFVDGGLEVGGDEALSPHGSNMAWDDLIIPVYATPLQDALKRVVRVGVSEAADLHPLGSNVLHWVPQFAFVSEPSEAAVGALPPLSNSFCAFEAIEASKWSRHRCGEALKSRTLFREAADSPSAGFEVGGLIYAEAYLPWCALPRGAVLPELGPADDPLSESVVKVGSGVTFWVQLKAHVEYIRLAPNGLAIVVKLHFSELVIGSPLDFVGLNGHAIFAKKSSSAPYEAL